LVFTGTSAGLEQAEHALEVLGAVVEVVRHLVLPLPAPPCSRVCGDAVGAPVELRPREAALALHLGDRVGETVGVAFPDVGEVPAVRAWLVALGAIGLTGS
jgi:hypothetical protein